MNYQFPGAYPGQMVSLTFDQRNFRDPGYVLIFPFYQGRLQLTHHRERGWELPGGTRNQGEFPIVTAIREMYEETGSELAAIEPIAQYVIEAPGEPLFVKTIYVAQIGGLHPIPKGFETIDVRLFDSPPHPDEVRGRDDFSPILKDDVYRLTLQAVLAHRFAKR